MPDVFSVFLNASVCGKSSCPCNVDKRFGVPVKLVAVDAVHFAVNIHIAVKIRKTHVRVRNRRTSHEILRDMREVLTADIAVEPFDNPSQNVVVIVVMS